MEALLNFLGNVYTPVMMQLKVLGTVVAQIAFAIVVLAVAVWILGLLKSVLLWLLNLLQIDKLADIVGANAIVKKVSPAGFSATLATILYWISMIGVLIAVLNLLGVGKSVTRIVEYMVASILPNVLSALFVMIVAILLAQFISGIVKLISGYFNVINSEIFAKVTSFVILLYATIVAIGQLDIISTDLLNTCLLIAFIGFALSAALGSTKESAAALKALTAKAVATPAKKKATKKKK